MTALFCVMFVKQWEDTKDHGPALIGLIGSAVFNVPGRKRTTGIFGDCIYRTPSQMEKEHIAQYWRWNCFLYAVGAVCILQVT